jgi:two-component system copper resistance phosphate regulon response regulator CusR
MTRILVVDDDIKALRLMHQGLSEEGFEVDTCDSGAEGLQRALSSRPDLMVLDVMLPELDGWMVLEKLRNAGVSLPILMLTARDAVEYRVKGLMLGADDYITKPFAFSELLARIRTVMRRVSPPPPDDLSLEDLSVDVRRQKVMRADTNIDLTANEFRLLVLLLNHKGEVLSRDYISQQIWDMQVHSDSNVVDVNIRRLRAKIDDPFSRKLVQTVRGRGYVVR